MDLKKRILAISAVIIVCLSIVCMGIENNYFKIGEGQSLISSRASLKLWYTDDELTDYISRVALKFFEETNIRVIPVQMSGLEYVERIYDASIGTNDYPDLFFVSNDSLEKAYLAGVASVIQEEEAFVNEDNYSKAALEAVTYKDKLVAYPASFETSVLLYNETYLMEYLEKELQALKDVAIANGENIPELVMTEEQEAQYLQKKLEELIPSTIDDILSFANDYDAAENVESVFKWDVSDIFYNYFFVGNSLNVGGPNGDDPKQIDIYNEDSLKSLKVYQDLNQFFSIEADEVDYNSVLQEFIDGKVIFSVVTTDAIGILEEAIKEGTFPYEYGIEMIPDINESISSKSLSVTNTVVVNGFSKEKELANQLAKYLVFDQVESLYISSGKVPARKNIAFDNTKLLKAMQEYETSIPITKMIEASNFWVQLEICFTKIWEGEDVNSNLRQLSEQIMTQVTGEPFEEAIIKEEVEEVIEDVEYVDDEDVSDESTLE